MSREELGARFWIVALAATIVGVCVLGSGCYKGQFETGSAGGLHPINSGCFTYAQTYPKLGYPQKLSQLGPSPSDGGADEQHANLVDKVLAAGEKSGYRIEYVPGPKDAQGTINSYRVTSRPLKYGSNGTRSYFTDQSGVIRYTDEDREPNERDAQLK